MPPKSARTEAGNPLIVLSGKLLLMRPPAFQFYADDFLAGTSDMTTEEVGAYIRLLCHQWNKGGIPNDPERIALMSGGIAKPHAVAKFRLCEDGMLRNARLERERDKQTKYREKQAVNGAKRWVGNAKPHAKDEPNACSPSPSPSPSNTPIVPKGDEGEVEPKSQYSEQFEQFWLAYPKRVGKGAAWKAWQKAKDKPPFAAIHAAIMAQTSTEQWRKADGQFIPLPATWLNQRRWDDEVKATAQQGERFIA